MTDNNVVEFPGNTKAEIPPEKILQAALDANLRTVVIMGEEQSGAHYFASSIGYLPDINWLLDNAKDAVLDMALNEEG